MIDLTREDLIDGDRFEALADFKCASDDVKLADFLRSADSFRRAGAATSVLLYAETHRANPLLRVAAQFPGIRITLITHNSDGVVRDREIGQYDADFRLRPPNVVRWFAQNIEAVDPLLVPIPIGLERDRWFPQLRKKDQLLLARSQAAVAPQKLLYVNHNIATNPAQRRPIYDLFASQPWATCRMAPNGADYGRFLHDIRAHAFTISPNGNGIDCHRTWEVLYLDRVPIVQRSHNNVLIYSDLPVLLVDDFSQVTESLLLAYLENPPKRSTDKLKFAYYKSLIRATAW